MRHIPENEMRFAVLCVTRHGDVEAEFFRYREAAEDYAKISAEEEGQDFLIFQLIDTQRAPEIPSAPLGVPDPYGWEALDAYRRKNSRRPFAA